MVTHTPLLTFEFEFVTLVLTDNGILSQLFEFGPNIVKEFQKSVLSGGYHGSMIVNGHDLLDKPFKKVVWLAKRGQVCLFWYGLFGGMTLLY